MIRKAIVAGISESWVDLLSLDEEEDALGNTQSNASCGNCGCRISGHAFKAANPDNIILKTGDKVELSSSGIRVFAASLTVIGLPIIGAIAAWYTIRMTFPGAAEGVFAAGAAGGFIITGLVAAFVGSRNRNRRLPRISAVVERHPS